MAKFDNCTQNEKKHISVKFYNYFLDVKKSREKKMKTIFWVRD